MMKVEYREPKKSDLAALLSYINELYDENTFIGMDRQTLKSERVWLAERLKRIQKKSAVTVLAVADGEVVGNCSINLQFKFKRRKHVSASMGIAVLKAWRGKGIGETLARKALALAKKRMKINFLTLSHLGGNKVARNLYLKLGFKECGLHPKVFWYRGKWVDEILMYMKL